MMDDFSKYAEVHVMTEKSEAKEKAVEILQRWMTQLDVKILRSVGGKELTGNLVSDFCKSKGIVQQITPRYTPESNGKIEGLNRTVKEKNAQSHLSVSQRVMRRRAVPALTTGSQR